MDETTLKGNSTRRNNLGRLTKRGPDNRLIVSIFKAKGSELVSSGGRAIDRTVFRDETGPLTIKMKIKNATTKKDQGGPEKNGRRERQMGLVTTIEDSIGARRAIFKVSQKMANGFHRGALRPRRATKR